MLRNKPGVFGVIGVFVCLAWSPAYALDQWAATVINFSSQYSSPNWSAAQTLGAPNTLTYGDIPTAWAPGSKNGTHEYVTLGFARAVYATGVTVRETWGNGFVERVDVLDAQGNAYKVWSGVDPSQPGSPVDFLITWPTTNFLVKRVKIYVNTDHDLLTYEEIDAVQLHGETTPPQPDLIVRSIVGPVQGVIGQPVTVTTSVRNQGEGHAGSFVVGLYLSSDRTIHAATDRFLGGIRLPAVQGLKTSTFTLLLVVPETLTPGAYYLGAIADQEDTVPETNETNNTRATGTPIQIVP